MENWDIVTGLMVLSFTVPFLMLQSKLRQARERASVKNSEIKHLRRRLTETEEHIRRDQSLFLEALGVPFLLMRPGGRVVMANKNACEFFEQERLSGINLLHILPENQLKQALQQAATAPDQFHTLLTVQQTDGERYYRMTATRLNTQERHIGIVFLDMTEEQRAQIIRRDFVANASHELRTPLTLILGYLETLLDSPEAAEDAEMRQRSLGIMKRHADRMARLVSDMLLLSRAEIADSVHLKKETFNLASTAEEVIQRLNRQADARQATLKLDFDSTPFTIRGDAFYWDQILSNLLENALKNNPQSHLQVCLRAATLPDGSRKITVTDNGIGIPPHALPYIFNRFYRADNTGKIKGSGLGLAIVKHAVEAHGGSISVQSFPGEKTEFCITLPPGD